MQNRASGKSPKVEWNWRQKYRVWAPDRKTFLYPENWVEPELHLPARVSASLRKIEDFIRKECEPKSSRRLARKKGVHVLFASDNRMAALVAAQTLAQALHLSLYQIDLSRVVSKYIGETEKNLRRFFDLAGRQNAVLLFEEADALFGKRSDVKDSHDRFANVEVSYLLRRIEEYAGLSILAVARKAKMDQAFSRVFPFRIAATAPPGRKA